MELIPCNRHILFVMLKYGQITMLKTVHRENWGRSRSSSRLLLFQWHGLAICSNYQQENVYVNNQKDIPQNMLIWLNHCKPLKHGKVLRLQYPLLEIYYFRNKRSIEKKMNWYTVQARQIIESQIIESYNCCLCWGGNNDCISKSQNYRHQDEIKI